MRADWKNEEYTALTVEALNSLGQQMLNTKPNDWSNFSGSNWDKLSKENKIQFYVMLISSMARRESGFKPETTYTEKFADANGVRVVSRGLLQLSIESCRGYGIKIKDAKDLHDPKTNIAAAVVIMNKWVSKDLVISKLSNGKYLGAGRYWSVIRPGAGHYLKEIQSKTNSLTFNKEMPVGTSKKRLALIVGHEKKAKGAFSKTLGESEYTWNSDLARIAMNYALESGIDCEVFLRDGFGIAGTVANAVKWKPDCIIEIHFNAADGKASGTETLYADSADDFGVNEVVFAKLVNDGMVEALGLKDRGIKKLMPGGRGYGNVSGTKSIPSILIETGFGDNPKDANAMAKNKQALAKAIVNAFKEFKGV